MLEICCRLALAWVGVGSRNTLLPVGSLSESVTLPWNPVAICATPKSPKPASDSQSVMWKASRTLIITV